MQELADLLPEECDLIGKTIEGDQSAFSQLVDRYKSPVYNLCYRMLSNPSDAEDASQEVLLRAYTQIKTYQRDRKFSTWLLSIASHLCIDLLRRRRHSWLSLDTIVLWKQSDDPEPEAAALDHEDQEAARALLLKIPEKYRLVTILRYWHDMSYDEIAEATHLSESAVKTRLHRARSMLAEKMMKEKEARNDALSRSW